MKDGVFVGGPLAGERIRIGGGGSDFVEHHLELAHPTMKRVRCQYGLDGVGADGVLQYTYLRMVMVTDE